MKDRLNGMRIFAHVVEAKSFSAAAEQLEMSTSVASRHVSSLERALSVKLLNRSTRRLSLTDAGALFYEHCARIVQEAELAEERLTETQSEPAGLVRITAVPAFAIRHVLPALAEFNQRYPKIQVKLFCSNRPIDLGAEGFDLGIRVAFNPLPNFVARKLAANRSALCAAPEYIKRRGTPRRIEDLQKHDCVIFPAFTIRGTWTFQQQRHNVGVPVSGTFETDEMDVMRAAVIAGMGIGVLPLYVAADAIRQGQLVTLLRGFELVPASAIYLVYLPNRTLSLRVRALIDFFANRFAPVPPWEAGL